MLPGLRFLFAATLMCASLLVFGMGAIALMRASHQQFASAPPRQPPEPVFAQAPETVPSLSLLRVDPATPALTYALPDDRSAALTSAERANESAPAPVMTEPKPAEESRGEAAPVGDPPPMPAVTPLAAKAPADATGRLADTLSAADKSPEPVQPEAAPAQVAAIPETAAPETTGSIAMPEDQPVEEQVIAEPPLPQARPVAALPAEAEPTRARPAAKPVAKPVIKRKVRHVRRQKAKSEKLPAATSAPTLGSLFGGGSSN